MTIAHLHILGTIGRDPVLRTAGESQVCDFSVAVNHRGKDKTGALTERTVWYKVSVWSRSGQAAAQHLRKGMRVYIHGTHDVETYTDAQGQARTANLIRNAVWDFADAKRSDQPAAIAPAAAASAPAPAENPAGKRAAAVDDDEPPF